mgnify:FL=1
MDAAKILIVDDEKFVRRTISRVLSSEGFATFEASNGPDALRMAQEKSFDLMLDGFQVIRTLRDLGILLPVFVLSGRQADNDKILALGIGADDYITKPFSTTVLCAKVKACLRRMGLSSGQRESILSLGPFRYVCDEMRLFREGTEIPLSSKESLLIKYFFNNPNKILSKEQIYRNVWGNDVVDDNTIMVHIRHLRVKIEADATRPNYLRTIRGVGYQFVI